MWAPLDPLERTLPNVILIVIDRPLPRLHRDRNFWDKIMADDKSELNTVELATELTIAWLSNPNTRAGADEVPAFLQKMRSGDWSFDQWCRRARRCTFARVFASGDGPQIARLTRSHYLDDRR